MKVFVIVFAAMIASGVSVPQPDAGLLQVVNEAPEAATDDVSADKLLPSGRNLIADAASALIERIVKCIKDMGLDPMYIEEFNFAYALPVPSLFGVEVAGENIVVRGISDIVINDLSYSVLTSRLTFNLTLPQIAMDIGNLRLRVHVLSQPVYTEYSGNITITNLGMAGTARASLSIISGITVRDLVLDGHLGNIDATVSSFTAFGADYTRALETFINVNFFNAIKDHKDDIDEMMEIIAWSLIGRTQ